MDFDVIIIGGGLAGLVAAAEAADRGRRVIILDQEGEQNLGGQAFWSLGGLFMVDTPEQRRMRIRDNRALARQDWLGSAQFDRAEDAWPRLWADAYLDFAAGSMRSWLHQMGMRWFPVVGWAERGGALADGHGNSVPRFHVTWGTGPGVLEPFIRRVRGHQKNGRVKLLFRHRVTGLDKSGGAVTGVSGDILEPTPVLRAASNRRAPLSGHFGWHRKASLLRQAASAAIMPRCARLGRRTGSVHRRKRWWLACRTMSMAT